MALLTLHTEKIQYFNACTCSDWVREDNVLLVKILENIWSWKHNTKLRINKTRTYIKHDLLDQLILIISLQQLSEPLNILSIKNYQLVLPSNTPPLHNLHYNRAAHITPTHAESWLWITFSNKVVRKRTIISGGSLLSLRNTAGKSSNGVRENYYSEKKENSLFNDNILAMTLVSLMTRNDKANFMKQILTEFPPS